MKQENQFESEAQKLRVSFLARALESGKLIKTGENLQLKQIKPKTIFALDNAYYEMLISSEHYCKYVDHIHREFYTTKTYKTGEVLLWQN